MPKDTVNVVQTYTLETQVEVEADNWDAACDAAETKATAKVEAKLDVAGIISYPEDTQEYQFVDCDVETDDDYNPLEEEEEEEEEGEDA